MSRRRLKWDQPFNHILSDLCCSARMRIGALGQVPISALKAERRSGLRTAGSPDAGVEGYMATALSDIFEPQYARGTVILPTGYRPSANEEFMGDEQLAYFRQKLLEWKDAIVRRSRETMAQLKSGPDPRSRYHRPRLERDRLGDRASDPRPAAQAHFQDRRRAAPHRSGRIWILRSDRRADLSRAPRSPADRDHDCRGRAGAPRTSAACVQGRLSVSRQAGGLTRDTPC